MFYYNNNKSNDKVNKNDKVSNNDKVNKNDKVNNKVNIIKGSFNPRDFIA